MATESLIVELDARTKLLDAKLQSTDDKLDKLDKSVKKTEMSLTSMVKVGVAGLTAFAASAGIAINNAVSFARELDVASTRANISAEAMQSLAFATNTVNVSTEKLGDIYKDTNEKVGEFLATGGGGFKDFTDVLRMTDDQAQKTAESFSQLSAPEILQEMVDQMEAAGVSGQKMSFALEGMASYTTDLIPLLRDGGKELNSLTQNFDDLGIALSTTDLQKIKDVGVEFSKFTQGFSAGSKQLVADYSEEIIKALTITTIFATKTVDAFNVVATGWGNIVALAGAALNDLVNGVSTFDQVLAERTAMSAEAINELLGENFFDAGYQLGKNMSDGMNEALKDGQSNALEIMIKGGKQETDWQKLTSKQKIDVQRQGLQSAKILNQALLDDNKAINAGLIVADTAAGIMRAYKEANFWVATGQAVIIAATGLAQLSNLNSASKGGGSIGAGGSGGGGSTQAPQQADFVPETSNLEISEQTDQGTSFGNVTLDLGGGEFLEVLATRMEENNRNGG
tara:strand:+ start:2678 stop:4213 length:1536 start_codon:yes stop_codon:yes gene_type:complete